ncbi:two-component system, response regulator YesN [Evansella caseinilytica]|uniref:Two-component system, response regulator YesN n=1 Tax=Evansella caseinilytica TaxID=1503961 RepID=A0A1H3S215_9BACI|nr:helix-turn-helix domain-containing protein [Evansella caseinilytica]SDZ31199.1 two-component system, response regulator YesN [Evansella caseinilytica]
MVCTAMPENNRDVRHRKKRSIPWTETMETGRKLSEAIRYADEQSATQILAAHLQKLTDSPYHKATAVRIGIELWTMITYSLYDIGLAIDQLFPEGDDICNELFKKNSWDELGMFLKNNVVNLCNHQRWEENVKHRQLVEQMIDYVHHHLGKNITLQDIADELYISRNYLGQIFKKVTGESFKSYMTRVRMEKAKQMIQEGNYLIYEVSAKLGFGNPAYFTTTFKKYTGYTPTDLIYRASCK